MRRYGYGMWGTSTLINTLTGPPGWIWTLAFSPDSTTLAAGSYDGTVHLWDVGAGTLKDTFTEHTDNVRTLAFSPDGNTLATGSEDGTVRLWDVGAGTLKNTFTEHKSWVNSVAFSPDGNTLATGSSDGTVLLWDIAPAADAYPAWDVNEDGQTSIVDIIVILADFEKTPIVNPARRCQWRRYRGQTRYHHHCQTPR